MLIVSLVYAPDFVRLCPRAGKGGLPSGEDGGTEGVSIDPLATDAGRIDVEVGYSPEPPVGPGVHG